MPQRAPYGPVHFHFHFHIHETFTFTPSGVLHVPQRAPHGPVHLSRRNSFLIAARDVRLEGEGDLDQNNAMMWVRTITMMTLNPGGVQ